MSFQTVHAIAAHNKATHDQRQAAAIWADYRKNPERWQGVNPAQRAQSNWWADMALWEDSPPEKHGYRGGFDYDGKWDIATHRTLESRPVERNAIESITNPSYIRATIIQYNDVRYPPETLKQPANYSPLTAYVQ